MSHSAAKSSSTEPELDHRTLRDAFGRFAPGVAFVTAEVAGTPHGLIVSSFAAVSLEPPLVSFCPARSSLTWRRMREPRRFGGPCPGDVARRVRSSCRGAGRGPVHEPLEGALAVIECELEAEHPAGDHSIVVGRVTRLQLSADTDPLVYFAGGFGASHTD
jgi:flavin reductase (DIM6/NTAB) family NADH-FMN oxidoreductase RutF